MPVSEKKRQYGQRLIELVEQHQNILIAEADNVASLQMQQVRNDLRGRATIMMGKNVSMLACLSTYDPG